MSTASADALSDLEQRLIGGTSLGEQLSTMFKRFGEAAASPTDPIARESVIASIEDLVDGIHMRAAELDAAKAELNTRIKDNAKQASELAKRLAEANKSIGKTNDPVMRDERDRIASQLSSLVGGSARVDSDGQMRFGLDGGAVLVDGTHASALEATPDPATGDTSLAVVDGSARRDVTAAIRGGTIGAQLGVRDGDLAKARTALDQLAYDVVQSTNSVHAANAGLDGVSGRNLFSPLGGVAGAAAAIAIDPAVEADPSKLALAAIGGGPGSNAGALAMFQLANQNVAAGGKTLGNAALELVGNVASAAASATDDVKRDQLVADNLAGLRDSLAGVDIEEEMTNLARFEHASSAMTKFVSTINEMLGDLIDRL
jgi:flagellar hook-associated protein 1 FlgK